MGRMKLQLSLIILSTLILTTLQVNIIEENNVITRVACRWRGTAPFCEGRCHKQEYKLKSSVRGDGKLCLIGKKVKCCRIVNEKFSNDADLQEKIRSVLQEKKGSNFAW